MIYSEAIRVSVKYDFEHHFPEDNLPDRDGLKTKKASF